jgi:hypothetical protein
LDTGNANTLDAGPASGVLKSFMEWADEFRLGIAYPEITEMQARAIF